MSNLPPAPLSGCSGMLARLRDPCCCVHEERGPAQKACQGRQEQGILGPRVVEEVIFGNPFHAVYVILGSTANGCGRVPSRKNGILRGPIMSSPRLFLAEAINEGFIVDQDSHWCPVRCVRQLYQEIQPCWQIWLPECVSASSPGTITNRTRTVAPEGEGVMDPQRLGYFAQREALAESLP
ncbi:hypothetical protein E2C01_033360 [Portunus trituberculatus]|uniref:Uncharacterized protein n=1 Tax=Portunus trituberculatus TaxID=210409 RepID=A0A5B7EYH5_PORTR|nr:hypothetical protein [Portunus trituberculatus]